MKRHFLYIVPFLTLLGSCKEEAKPKVKYNQPAVKTEIKKDTSRLEVSDLPIQFEGAKFLVYPVGDLQLGEVSKEKFDSRSYEDNVTFNVSNSIDNEISGYLRNIKFQAVGQDSIYALTDKMMMIERMTFLAKKKMFVYVLADTDTNQDNVIDSDDVKSLYLSTETGAGFAKISPDIQELIDWNYIDATRKIYLRTIEDANKNGAFDKDDIMHYYYVDVTSKEWKAVEYFPVK